MQQVERVSERPAGKVPAEVFELKLHLWDGAAVPMMSGEGTALQVVLICHRPDDPLKIS